jgi:hypothetical protein
MSYKFQHLQITGLATSNGENSSTCCVESSNVNPTVSVALNTIIKIDIPIVIHKDW